MLVSTLSRAATSSYYGGYVFVAIIQWSCQMEPQSRILALPGSLAILTCIRWSLDDDAQREITRTVLAVSLAPRGARATPLQLKCSRDIPFPTLPEKKKKKSLSCRWINSFMRCNYSQGNLRRQRRPRRMTCIHYMPDWTASCSPGSGVAINIKSNCRMLSCTRLARTWRRQSCFLYSSVMRCARSSSPMNPYEILWMRRNAGYPKLRSESEAFRLPKAPPPPSPQSRTLTVHLYHPSF